MKQAPGTPDTITILSFALLGVVAVLLLLPLFGAARPPLWIFAVLLTARLGLRIWRSARLPSELRRPELRRPELRRRASGWVLDALLITLLLWVSFVQH